MHLAARAVAVIGLVLGFVIAQPAGAGAHTSLESSEPANRAMLMAAPTTARLTFTEAISASATSLTVLDTEARPAGTATSKSSGTGFTHEWALSEVKPGSYGLRYLSVGDDGHRVTGDILFVVQATGAPTGDPKQAAAEPAPGAVAPAVLGAVSSLPADQSQNRFTAFGTLARLGWYLGLALAAGSLWMLAMRARRGVFPISLAASACLSLRRGLALAAAFALVRLAVTSAALASVGTGGSTWQGVLDLYAAESTVIWVTAAALLVAARHVAVRLHWQAPSIARLYVVAALLIGAAAVSAAAGHGEGISDWWTEVLHLVAASLWVGPMVLFMLIVSRSQWRALDASERSATTRQVFKAFTPTATWSFVVLALSGTHMAWARAGGNEMNDYMALVLVKVALVLAVVLPLAWYHRRSFTVEPSTRAADGRTLGTETAALLIVMMIASVLTGTSPIAEGRASSFAVAPRSVVPSEALKVCTEAKLGQEACFSDYYVAIQQADGAKKALDAVGVDSSTNPKVAESCHQIVHAIGRKAAATTTITQAFAINASVCWAGYYHGVMEETLSKVSEAELASKLPTVCTDPSLEQYGFAHYNCAHGTGHGLSIRYDGNHETALRGCDLMADSWEKLACGSGVFMQNIVATVQHEKGAVAYSDPMQPCPIVSEFYKGECYQMQPTMVLYTNETDYGAAFRACDAVESGYVDECYRAIGIAVSGWNLLDASKVKELCGLGSPSHQSDCIYAAAANAVKDRSDSLKADELCQILEGSLAATCATGRDDAMKAL